jgi:hypothetical protein
MDRNDAKRVIKDLKEKPYIFTKDYIETASGFIITVNNTTEQKKQTNADHIRSMSDEELAEFLVEHHRNPCKFCLGCWTIRKRAKGGCKEGLMQWLKSEAKE